MGTDPLRLFPDEALVDGDFPPAEDGLPLFLYDFLENPLLFFPEIFVAVGKNHTHPVLPFRREVKSQDLALPLEEFVRNLGKDAGAVATLPVCPLAAPVLQVLQNFQGIIHDAVGPLSFDICHKSDAAGIMLIPRVIETLGLR
mgnify:CR=1 FL=1